MKIRIECTDSQNTTKNICTIIDSSIIRSMYNKFGNNAVIETIPMLVEEINNQLRTVYDCTTDTWKNNEN